MRKKPNITIPEQFAPYGEKTDFTNELINNGFDKIKPEILAGDNLNKFIDDTYKGLHGVLGLYEGIVLHDMTTVYNKTSVVGNFINEEFKLYKSLQDNNIGHYVTETEYWEELKLGGGSGFNLFDTKLSDHILEGNEAKGWALQGTYVYKEAVAGSRDGYPDFYNKVIEEYNGATLTETVNGITVKVNPNGHKFYDIADKTTIDEVFNTTGSAWLYGVDTANERVFLPRINNRYLVEKKEPTEEDPTWYNLYSDGWCEQGGHITFTGSATTTAFVSLLKPYKNTDYFVVGNPLSTSTDMYGQCYNLTLNGFTMKGYGKQANCWEASGYVEKSETQKSFEDYLYICVGNTNVETAVTEVVDVTTTENDTVPLFTGQYFDFAPNNLSWLKGGEQANSGDIYTTAYNELVNCLNGINKYNLKVIDTADMISGVDYSEYWKVNQAEMYFVTPTKLSYGALTKNVVSDGLAVTFSSVEPGSTPVENVTIDMKARGGANGTVGTSAVTGITDSGILGFGNQTGLTTEESTTAQLYFKVANAVQNLELLNVGEIVESLADKVDVLNTQWAVNACIPDYSMGITPSHPTSEAPFTAPADGVFLESFYYSKDTTSKLFINDIETAFCMVTGSTYRNNRDNVIVPLKKGDVIYWNTGVTESFGIGFYPYKGGEQ